mgnify:CR=1 FL=1
MNFDDNKTLKQNIEDNCPELNLMDSYNPFINNFLDLQKDSKEYKDLSTQIKDKHIFLSKYFSIYIEKIKQHFSQDVNISFNKNKKILFIEFSGVKVTYENGEMSFDIFATHKTLKDLKEFDKKYLKFRKDIDKFNDNNFFDKIFEDFDLLNKTISQLETLSLEYNLNAKLIENKNKLKITQFSKLFRLANFDNEKTFIKEQISEGNFKGGDDDNARIKINFVTFRFNFQNLLFTTHTLKVIPTNEGFSYNLNGKDTDNFMNLINNSFYIDDKFISNKGCFKDFNVQLSTKGRIQYKELIEKFKLKIQQQNIVDF